MPSVSRYSVTPQQDSPPQAEGDATWIGMNMKQDRSTLPQGFCALSVNKRLASGRAEDRLGTLTPVWANIQPFNAILGSGLYANPNGDEVILIADTNSVWAIRSGSYPTPVKIPANSVLSVSKNATRIEFSQTFNTVFMDGAALNGVDTTLSWDGVNPAGFTPIVQQVPLDATRALTPWVPWSIDMEDRRIFPLEESAISPSGPVTPDTIGVTDIGDYTDYDFSLGTFRVNVGTSDSVVGAFPFPQNIVVVGKTKSWDGLFNFVGDFLNPLSADFNNPNMQIISTEIGLSGRRTARMIGGDMIFAYRTGIYRLNTIFQLQLQVSPSPVASYTDEQTGKVIDPINPIIDGIDWTKSDQFVGAVLSPYYFLWVIMKDKTGRMLVYNNINDAWEGYDTWVDPNFMVSNLVVTDYLGSQRVYAICNGTKSIHVLYEGSYDYTVGVDIQHPLQNEVVSQFETRGYAQVGGDYATNRDALKVDIGFSTWRPSIQVSLITERAFDTRVTNPTAITKNPAKYYRFGFYDYDVSNVNGDFATPGREDYSVHLPVQQGVICNQKTERAERISLKTRSRVVSFRIVNSQGKADITGLLFLSAGKPRSQIRRAG